LIALRFEDDAGKGARPDQPPDKRTDKSYSITVSALIRSVGGKLIPNASVTPTFWKGDKFAGRPDTAWQDQFKAKFGIHS
jgi:hypothetical protein